MQRFGVWIEPVLVAEWVRLTRAYALRMGLDLAPGAVEARMVWSEPSRDTTLARMAAARIAASGMQIHCVWSGVALEADVLDVDHALPWSAWPCNDLWNLMPASRRVNQHEKRDRLPAAHVLANARGAIVDWWSRGVERGCRPGRALRDRSAGGVADRGRLESGSRLRRHGMAPAAGAAGSGAASLGRIGITRPRCCVRPTIQTLPRHPFAPGAVRNRAIFASCHFTAKKRSRLAHQARRAPTLEDEGDPLSQEVGRAPHERLRSLVGGDRGAVEGAEPMIADGLVVADRERRRGLFARRVDHRRGERPARFKAQRPRHPRAARDATAGDDVGHRAAVEVAVRIRYGVVERREEPTPVEPDEAGVAEPVVRRRADPERQGARYLGLAAPASRPEGR